MKFGYQRKDVNYFFPKLALKQIYQSVKKTILKLGSLLKEMTSSRILKHDSVYRTVNSECQTYHPVPCIVELFISGEQ